MNSILALPILSFPSSALWRQWLEENHSVSSGIWVRFFKKNSGVQTISYDEALDEALCYGWIDSQVRSYDAKSYLQKFTPRRTQSVWSKRNTEHIERLIQEGRMKPAGLVQVSEAKADGRWDRAYSSPANLTLPDDFLRELSLHKKAKAFFETLSRANVYAIAWRLQTAKNQVIKSRRMEMILKMLENGEKFHE